LADKPAEGRLIFSFHQFFLSKLGELALPEIGSGHTDDRQGWLLLAILCVIRISDLQKRWQFQIEIQERDDTQIPEHHP